MESKRKLLDLAIKKAMIFRERERKGISVFRDTVEMRIILVDIHEDEFLRITPSKNPKLRFKPHLVKFTNSP